MLKNSSRWSGDYWHVVFAVFAILSLANTFGLLLGWFNSVDVKGGWPFALLLYSVVSMLYASAFSKLMTLYGRSHVWFIFTYNLTLASLLFIKSYLFYAIEIDWLKVNSGEMELSFFQSIVYGDSSLYVLYGVFLFGSVIAGQAYSRIGSSKIV